MRKSFTLTILVLMLPAIAAPELSARLFNEASVEKAGDNDPVGYDADRESPTGIEEADQPGNDGNSDENEDSKSGGRFAAPPAPFELLQRSAWSAVMVKLAPRPLEKHALRPYSVARLRHRGDRVVVEIRNASLSLAVVAPPIQSHAPPSEALG